ncbi:MAG: pilus assembly protein [Hyphomicrobiales bacterium]|nr:pilus assembly protein [Hyphomicrobiales bacterium]
MPHVISPQRNPLLALTVCAACLFPVAAQAQAAGPEAAQPASSAQARRAAQAHQGNETIMVVLDEAKVLQLPPSATTVIVGNPLIADVTMLKKTNQMVLTGKGYGQTNLIALDGRGKSVGESTLRVVGPQHGLVIQRGLERESYDCAPRCQPTARLGDSQKFTAEAVTGITSRNQASQPGR